MIKANFQWTACFVSIALSKGAKCIIEVTMTLAKHFFHILLKQRFRNSLVAFLVNVLSEHHILKC